MATLGSSPSPPPPEPQPQAVHALDAQFPALAKSHRDVRCIVKLGEFWLRSVWSWDETFVVC